MQSSWSKNGVLAVAEGANMPTTLEATKNIYKSMVFYLFLVKRLMLVESLFQKARNESKLRTLELDFEQTDEKLKEIMQRSIKISNKQLKNMALKMILF